MRRLFMSVAVLAAAVPAVSQAAVSVTATPYAFAIPAADVAIDFDSALPTGFTLTGGMLNTGTNMSGTAPWVQPNVSNATAYLSVPTGSATLQGGIGYAQMSFYVGSLDTFNTLTLLDTTGSTIETFTGAALALTPGYLHNNNRFTFTASAGGAGIAGFTASSTRPSFEIDNVVFSGAVPEPESWALMIGGLAVAGGSLRVRRRAAAVKAG